MEKEKNNLSVRLQLKGKYCRYSINKVSKVQAFEASTSHWLNYLVLIKTHLA